MYRYYLTQRPPSLGTHPSKNVENVVSFDEKTNGVWGYVDYTCPLTEKEISDYELAGESPRLKGEEK